MILLFNSPNNALSFEIFEALRKTLNKIFWAH